MIVLDYKDRRPIYEQVVEKFQTLIIKGILEQDTQIPSVRKLAMELSINPNTIQRAYNMLETQGYIYPVKGRGNFVAPQSSFIDQKKKRFYEELDILLKQAPDIGITYIELTEHIVEVYKEGN